LVLSTCILAAGGERARAQNDTSLRELPPIQVPERSDEPWLIRSCLAVHLW